MPGVPMKTLPISTTVYTILYTNILTYSNVIYLMTTYIILKDFVNLQKMGTLRRWQPKHLLSCGHWKTMGINSPFLRRLWSHTITPSALKKRYQSLQRKGESHSPMQFFIVDHGLWRVQIMVINKKSKGVASYTGADQSGISQYPIDKLWGFQPMNISEGSRPSIIKHRMR